MFLRTNKYSQFDSLEIKESIFKEFDLPRHFHDTYCIGLLCQGLKKVNINDHSQIMHSNSVSIINPYQVHADQNIDNSDSHFRMIYLNKEVLSYFSKILMRAPNENFTFSSDLITEPSVISAVQKFFQDTDRTNLLEQKLKNLVSVILSKRYLIDNHEINNEHRNAIDDSIEWARLYFPEKIDIGKLANEVRMSKYKFIRSFKKKTGLTPASYILIHRINFAKNLLSQNISIGEIALVAGFYDHAQFCKFFKYYTNISPTEYRLTCNIIQA